MNMSETIHVIEDNSLRATGSGFEVNLRFKWYRSLPLSCIEGLQFWLDDQQVDRSLLHFGINGHRYRLDELPELVEEFWFILDSAVLGVDLPGRVGPGESHQVEVAFGMRAPYIRIGPGKFLTVMNRHSAIQLAG